MKDQDQLFVGISGHLVCLRRSTGSELWRLKLGRSRSLTSIVVEEDTVFVASKGRVYAVNRRDGSLRWVNELVNLGYGACILSSSPQSVVAAAHTVKFAQSVAIGVMVGSAVVNAATR